MMPTPGRTNSRGGEFAVLKRQVAGAGLLRPAPAWYARRLAATLLMVATAWALVPFARTPILQVGASLALAFAFCQVGFLAHDAAHHQIMRSTRANERLALALFNGVVGLSLAWWMGKHGRHHVHPNNVVHDPDVAPGLLAFSQEQARCAPPASRWIVRRQAALFLPLLTLEGFSLRWESARVVLRGAARRPRLEAALMGLHFAVYFALLLWWLGGPGTLLFVIVHHVGMGLYLGLVFAPNHVAMPIFTETSDLDFARRQILASRNIRSGRIVDFVFGGLNRQIEHHLFPRMPRPNLRRARDIVRAFCQKHGIAYRECGLLASYAEVLTGLHRAASPLRAARPRWIELEAPAEDAT